MCQLVLKTWRLSFLAFCSKCRRYATTKPDDSCGIIQQLENHIAAAESDNGCKIRWQLQNQITIAESNGSSRISTILQQIQQVLIKSNKNSSWLFSPWLVQPLEEDYDQNFVATTHAAHPFLKGKLRHVIF